MRLSESMPWPHTRPNRPTLTLRITEMATDERYIVLESFPVIIGRSPEADVHLTDPWVSRVHCGLNCVDGRFVVRDLESQNGTWVNRERITEQALDVHDQINIGVTKIIVLGIDAGDTSG